jgi:hypothetical protein
MVNKINHQRNWLNLKVRDVIAYSEALGINLLAPSSRRDRRLIKAGKLAFMMKASPAQRRMCARLLGELGRPYDYGSGPRDSRGLLE